MSAARFRPSCPGFGPGLAHWSSALGLTCGPALLLGAALAPFGATGAGVPHFGVDGAELPPALAKLCQVLCVALAWPNCALVRGPAQAGAVLLNWLAVS